MSGNRKRKRDTIEESSTRLEDRSDLSLQAYEAVINPTSQQREVRFTGGGSTSMNSTGLIEWSVSGLEPILMDRYDARLLLDSLPTPSTSGVSNNLALGDGWDDLPSDSEDLFFFSLDEAEDIRREKRRRLMESNREDRLLAMKAAAVEEQPVNDWEGSDEEPDDSVKALMTKTATYFSSSQNPLQLEMRILANNGTDPRFAFLKGRWKDAWNSAKDASKAQAGKGSKSLSSAPATSELVAYDSGGEGGGNNIYLPTGRSTTDSVKDEAQIKAERRARAKEWSRKRREERGNM